ncbi:DUF4307 domain-containing protein [Aldersonia kunmingensis]|uniref:DUF4307 domain-containing protein n=1 Tax=Aldersonia kunmingensis TaxID=408066 RepID=UPI000834CABE|nr:DUF4307 domain-containing protein [Aldersonia kunmingensis]
MTHVGPADRYPSATGRRRSSRWVIVLLGVLVVALGIGIAYVGYREFGVKEIEGKQVSFEVVDDSTLTIKMGVTRQDPSRPAVCIVRARSRQGDETGRREVYVAPSDSGTVQFDVPIRTSRPPVIGEVYGCSFDVPAYLEVN